MPEGIWLDMLFMNDLSRVTDGRASLVGFLGCVESLQPPEDAA